MKYWCNQSLQVYSHTSVTLSMCQDLAGTHQCLIDIEVLIVITHSRHRTQIESCLLLSLTVAGSSANQSVPSKGAATHWHSSSHVTLRGAVTWIVGFAGRRGGWQVKGNVYSPVEQPGEMPESSQTNHTITAHD